MYAPRFLHWSMACLLACAVTRAHAKEPRYALDLESAISLALDQNLAFGQARLGVDQAANSKEAARSDFRIRFVPGATLDLSDDSTDWSYGLQARHKFSPGTEARLGGEIGRAGSDANDEPHRVTWRATLAQPLFRNFGTLVHLESLRLADSAWQRARRGYQQQKGALILSVVAAYEEIVRLRRQLQTEQTFFEQADRLYRLTLARERQGRTTRIDTLRVELQRGQAEQRIQNLREQLAIAEQSLAELLGMEPRTVFDLTPPPTLEVPLPPTREAETLAWRSRLDLAQALADYEDAERGNAIARRVRQPDLAVAARYEQRGTGESLPDATRFDQGDWFLGLTSGAEINPARDRSTLAQAGIALLSARENVQIVKLSISREVQQALANYRRVQADLKLAEQNVELADRRARLARRLFQAGRGDHFSVTDAEEAFLQSQNNWLDARSAVNLAAYRLLDVLGTLVETPDDLKPEALQASL